MRLIHSFSKELVHISSGVQKLGGEDFEQMKKQKGKENFSSISNIYNCKIIATTMSLLKAMVENRRR